MTDLTDALDNETVLTIEAVIYDRYPELVQSYLDVVDAARRVANPDIEAATAITNQLRFIKSGDEWDDLIHDITEKAINAALGIEE